MFSKSLTSLRTWKGGRDDWGDGKGGTGREEESRVRGRRREGILGGRGKGMEKKIGGRRKIQNWGKIGRSEGM